METRQAWYIKVLCAAGVVAVVMLFCYACTGRLKKFTAMEAVRNGSNGERFKNRAALKLSRRKGMRPVFFMACNDILTDFRRYATLWSVFCLGTLLILLPLSAINTLRSETVMRTFSMVPSPVYMDVGNMEQYMSDPDRTRMDRDMEQIEQVMRDNGLEGRVRVELGYLIPCYATEDGESYNYLTLQSQHYGGSDYDLQEGRFPEYDNEVVITAKVAEEMGVGIGDSVYFKLKDGDREFIITGIYEAMINMGNSFRVSEAAELEQETISLIFNMQVDLEGIEKEETAVERMSALFPDYKVYGTVESLDHMTGGIMDQLESLKMLIVAVVLLINCLITLLIMKTLVAGEHGEIAMLKSIGFDRRAVRAWQTVRILLVLGMAIIAGVLLCGLLAPVTIRPIFGMMGAPKIRLVLHTWESYVKYPLLLLAITGAAAYISSAEAGRVDLKEINSLE